MNLPEGPRSPALFQFLRWVREPLAFMDDCSRRFGDVFTIRMTAFGAFTFFSRPEHLKTIFTADPDVLHAGEANANVTAVLGPNSVLGIDGAAHLRQRRLLLPPFQGERMHAYAATMRDVTRRLLERCPTGEPFAIDGLTRAITLEVIVRTVFGVEDGAAKERLTGALARFMERTNGPYALALAATFRLLGEGFLRRRARGFSSEVDALIFEAIAARRREAGEREDILSLLLRARHEDGAPMSDEELRDELLTLLAAGHETTATALAWAFRLILSNPEVLERLRAEIAASGAPERVDAATLARLELTDAAIKETLRLRPIVPIVVRRVKAPFEVAGRTFPVGSTLAPCIYLAQRRPESYPEPERFRPERFLGAGAKLDPYTWLPFGGGTRRCIGMWFALYEMKVVLATVLAEAQLALAPGPPPRVSRRGITLAPSDGTRVVRASPARRGPVTGLVAAPRP